MSSLAERWNKIKLYQNELAWVLIIVLAVALGFGIGRASRLEAAREPLQIENVPLDTPPAGESAASSRAVPAAPLTTGKFLASKNGTRYYPVGCAAAKRIKPENIIWFQTVAEAEARGLAPAANC